jgi:uncharacterized protein YdhG (YjbR/CyaY superfamily)
MKQASPQDVAQYIAAFPAAARNMMQQLRRIIRRTAADAEESISYGMPAYKLKGRPLVYFAGYGQHVGFYPTPSGINAFLEDMAAYKYSKGAVQFPLDQPLPETLVEQITAFRVQEVLEKAGSKKTAQGRTTSNFAAQLSVPAQRALATAGIKTLKQLSKYSAKELMALHGFGAASLPKLQAALSAEGLSLKD